MGSFSHNFSHSISLPLSPLQPPPHPPAGRPSYTEIFEWRTMLRRLSSYLRYADYLVVELLRRLVTVATRRLHHFLSSSYDFGVDQEVAALEEGDEPLAAGANSLRLPTTTTASSVETTSVFTATEFVFLF